ncbi:hypothetical protein N865_06205 [Intrasporangium oryzae NRRL B-24470]|uniref:SGNH hydrolase-type esterase domain-containing protein n=1 Tax=Intrasporangium oryzae NRRL B-24470 TaxID=1386089 RepID=W9G8M2_9MICO|nr:hypothetical protein N865_06205 [Intrasporangium oryzae NRRL B-24470]
MGAGSSMSRASSADEGLVPGLPVYLALGDSIANGEASAPTLPAYWETVAGWRANGYVAQLDAALVTRLDCLPAASTHAADGCRQLQLLNLSRSAVPPLNGQPEKPGVTLPILIEEQLPTATALLGSRNHDANPRNDVEVVTITAGGADVLVPALGSCLGGDAGACSAALTSAFTEFTANFSHIVSDLRQAAGPDARIATMTLYNPLPFCVLGQADPAAAEAFGNWVLEGGTVPGFGTLPYGVNDIIRSVSQHYGAVTAETFGLLGAGDLVGGGDCRHPTRSGHTKIAGAFETALLGAPSP